MNKLFGTLISALETESEFRTEEHINNILKYLKDISVLSHCCNEDLILCAQTVGYKIYIKNDIIYKKSEKISCWYYIVQGSVLAGSEMFLPNNSFGQRVDTEKIRSCDCIVLEETFILIFPYDECTHARYPCVCLKKIKNYTLSQLSWTQKVTKKFQAGSETSSGYSGSGRISNEEIDSVSWHIGQGSIHSDTISGSSTYRKTSSTCSKTELFNLESDSDDDLSDITFNEISCQDEIKDILLKSSEKRSNQENEVIMNIIQNIPMFSLWTQSLRYAACKLVTLQIVEKANTVLTKKGDKLVNWGYCLQGVLEVRRTMDSKSRDPEKHLSEVLETLRYSDCFGADLRVSEEEISNYYLVTNSDNCWLMLINWSQFMLAKTQEPTKLSQIIENDKTVVVMEHRSNSDGSCQGNVIVKATVPRLIKYLFENHSPVEESYIENFFLTYNLYLESTVLVRNEIIDKVRRMPNSRKKCTEIVVKWIANHFHDIENQPEILKFLDLIVLMLFRENEEGLAGKIYHACSIHSKQRFVTIKCTDRDNKLKPTIVGNGSMINPKDTVTASLENYPNEFSHFSLFRNDQKLDGLYISLANDFTDLRHGDRILQINSVQENYLSQKAANDVIIKSQLSTLVVKYDPEGFYKPFLSNYACKTSLQRSKSIYSGKLKPQILAIEPGYSTLPLKPALNSTGIKNHGIIKKNTPNTTNQNATSSALKKMMKRCKANSSFTNEKKSKISSKSRSAHTSPERYQNSNPDLAFNDTFCDTVDDNAVMTTSLTSSSSSHLKVEPPTVKMRKMKNRCDSQPDLRKMVSSSSGELSTSTGEAVIKVYYKESGDLLSLKSNIRSIYLIISKDTEAIEVIVKSLFELNLTCVSSSDYVLCEVSVEPGPMVKQKIIKDNTCELASKARVNTRLYLKKRDFSGSLLDNNDMEEILLELNHSFLDLPLTEIASQIFLESYNKFKSTTLSEIVDFVTGKSRFEGGNTKSKTNKGFFTTEPITNFKEYLKLGEKYMYFVVNIVCNEHHSISKRGKILKKLIRLTRLCKELGNIEVFFSLMNGLDRVEINRLRNTWDRVPNKEMKMYRQMQQILDVSGNMRLLRSLHKTCNPPVIPMAALVTKDLTTINEVHSTKINADSVECNESGDEECLINFEKLRIIANRARSFKNSICSCKENENDHSDKCFILPIEETAQIEVIRNIILKVDNKERLKSLSNSQSNLAKRRSAYVNSKKIYDIEFNGLRVKHYLSKLDHLEIDDSVLLSLSYKCEPRTENSGMTPNISRSTIASLISSPTKNHELEDVFCNRHSTTASLSSKESGQTYISSGSDQFLEQVHLGSFRNHKHDRSNSAIPGQIQYLEPSVPRRSVLHPPPYSSLNSNPPIPPRRRLSVTSSENSNQDTSRSYSHPLMKDEVTTHL